MTKMTSTDEYLLDANIILRLFSGEPPEQTRQALTLLARAEAGEFTLKLPPITVAEIIYVLSGRFFRHNRQDIANRLIEFMAPGYISTDHQPTLLNALKLYSENNVDFEDAYLTSYAKNHNQGIASFDQDFQKLRVNQLLNPTDQSTH